VKTVRPSKARPRKTPRQDRSRATVDAISQAAAYILVKFGWEKFTTNAVADRAGVNIGSLYQYFPNKEAIVAELQRRHIAQTREKLRSALDSLYTQRTLQEALEVLVRAMTEEHLIEPAVHRAIAEELPRSVKFECGDEGVEAQLLHALQPFMKNVPNPEFAIQVALVAAHAVIHEAATHRPQMLERPEFVDELVTLIGAYLQRT
jgi:AcrR family transcriptional regulator